MPQQRGKSGQANSPRYAGLQIKRRRWRDGRQCIEPSVKPAGEDDCPDTFQHIYQEHHQRRPFPQGAQYVRCASGFGAMLSNIYAFKQPPCQIACWRRTEEISDCQSNQTRYLENHRFHLDALISGNPHLVVYIFDRVVSRLVNPRPSSRAGAPAQAKPRARR